MFKPFSRFNVHCETSETDFESCPLKPFNCLLSRLGTIGDVVRQIQMDDGNMTCIPSQLSQQFELCKKRKQAKKHKICDGAFLWCNEGAPVTSVLHKVPWLDKECSQKIAKECDLRYSCFQQCLQKQQSGECPFFAINTKNYRNSSGRLSAQNCQTFAALNATEGEFSSSLCEPWKVYQMNCVNGSCNDFDAIASTEASKVKAEYSTMVRGLCAMRPIKSVFVCILLCYVHVLGYNFLPLSMLQVDAVETEVNHETTGSVPHPYFRLNAQCETGYDYCIQFTAFRCDLNQQTDQGNMMCIPSQLRPVADVCNQRNSFGKYKICDGASEWCNGGAPAMSELLKIDWLTRACAEKVIGKECDVRQRCFQQCLKERQSGKCNFFAIKLHDCQTFSTLDGTGFSSSSCGPWKVYQMSCVDGACDDLDESGNTAASTVKTEYSTTVSGLCVSHRIIPPHPH